MKNNLIAAQLMCCLLLCFKISYAQTPTGSTAATATIEKFNNSIGRQSWLYSGPGYDLGKRIIQGNPNFLDTTVTDNKGTVVYNGFAYKDVPLLYNINKDILVTLWYDDQSRYCLFNDKVSEFTIFGHHFINLNPDSVSAKTIKPGFYDEAYKGKLQVLVKPTKRIHVVRALISPDDRYEPITYYYLKKSGIYHTVTSEGDMLDLLDDRKKELKQYIKDNDIKFRKDPAGAMSMLAAYYDQLTK